MRIPFSISAPGTRPFDVVGFGLNSIDLLTVVAEFPVSNSKQRLQRVARMPGGQTATALVTCARLGWRARYIGSFGDDEFGTISRESLIDEGVDISAARTVAGATNQFAVVVVDARTGERTVLWDRHPALTMTAEDVSQEAVTSGRVLIVDCQETAAATQAARYARAAGLLTVIDVEKVRPGIGDLLQNIDAIIAAEEFPTALTGYEDPGRALEAMAREFGAARHLCHAGRKGQPGLVRRPPDPHAGVSSGLPRQHRRRRCLSGRLHLRVSSDPGCGNRGCARVRQCRRRLELPGARGAGRHPAAG